MVNTHERPIFYCAKGAALWLITTTFVASLLAFPSLAQTAKIVGWGATSCSQFTQDMTQNPANEIAFFSWAQGYMSGILITRPPAVDETLDLNPASFPRSRQFEFLQAFCIEQSRAEFADAVQALYKRLRAETGF